MVITPIFNYQGHNATVTILYLYILLYLSCESSSEYKPFLVQDNINTKDFDNDFAIAEVSAGTTDQLISTDI